MTSPSDCARQRRKRVLVFSKGFPPDRGGLERYAMEIARAYRKVGVQPLVITQFSGRRGLRMHCGVPLLNVGPGTQPAVFLRMLFAARGVLRRRSFDFVHAGTWRVALPAIALGPPCPICVTLHGREFLTPGFAMAALMRWVFGRVSVFSAISRYTLRAAVDNGLVDPQRVFVNWNGVTDDASAPIATRPRHANSSTHVLFTICRLVERKNIQGCIRALALLRARGHDGFIYRVAGDGPYRPALEALARECGVDDCVEFVGSVSEARKLALYRDAEVFLHPQIALDAGRDFEGFGLVIAEAMTWGVPVIAGRAGGAADFVVDGTTGCLVDGEDVAQIADAIEALCADAQRARQLGQAGRDWVRSNLSWENNVRAILQRLDPQNSLPAGRQPRDSSGQMANTQN